MKKDRSLFNILVRDYHKMLFYYILSLTNDRATVDDLVQETFIIAYRKIDARAEIKDFGAWIRRIGHNLAMAHCRKNKRLRFVQIGDIAEELGCRFSGDSESDDRMWKRKIAALRSCMKKLQEGTRTIVNLFYENSLSTGEIAERLNKRADSVRHALCRARDALGQCIDRVVSETEG